LLEACRSWLPRALGADRGSSRPPALEHRWRLFLHEVEERQRLPQALAGRRVSADEVDALLLCSDAVRALTIGGDATTALLGTVAWFVGLMAIFVPLALVRYRALR
jgi:hypothetical protein